MSKRRFSLMLVPVLLLVGTLFGCDPRSEGPELLPTAPDNGLLSWLFGGEKKVEGYTLVKEPLLSSLTGSLSASTLIGLDGGELTLLGHTLSVPRGAVSQPTLFTILVLPTGYVEVDLGATLTQAVGGLLDVGSQGFAKPVPVTLTYSRATNVKDPSKLTVVRVNSLLGYRNLEPMPSRVDRESKSVTAELDHFSRYLLAMP